MILLHDSNAVYTESFESCQDVKIETALAVIKVVFCYSHNTADVIIEI